MAPSPGLLCAQFRSYPSAPQILPTDGAEDQKQAASARREGSRDPLEYPGRSVARESEFRDLGGGYPALIPEEETRATTDPEVAEQLLVELMSSLANERKNRVQPRLTPTPISPEFCIHHLKSEEYLQQ